MKYISPEYSKVNIASRDVACLSFGASTYEDKNGNTVQEMDFAFSDILKM